MMPVRLRPLVLLGTAGFAFAAENPTPTPAAPTPIPIVNQTAPGEATARALGYFSDGTALAVYRERSVDGVQDVHFSVWENNRWSESRVLVPEGWAPPTGPLAPPSLDARDGRAIAAWFTAADNDPRLQVSFSSDAGHVWQIPLRINEDRPGQSIGVVLLRDGSAITVWQEGEKIFLRRISPQNDLGPVSPVGNSAAPIEAVQLTVLADQDLKAPVSIALSYRAGTQATATVLTLPSLTALAKDDRPCACGQITAQPRTGFELRGVVVSVDVAKGITVVKHEHIPGVMPEMTMSFHADAATLRALTPGRELLGRMEQGEEGWRLLDVRLLAAPKK